MPVGTCVSRTAESVVLTDWPPRTGGAVDVDADVVLVDVDVVGGLHHGQHLDLGDDVWRRPWLSNGLIRTRRWVPISIDRVP